MKNVHNQNIEIIYVVGKLRSKPALTLFLGRSRNEVEIGVSVVSFVSVST